MKSSGPGRPEQVTQLAVTRGPLALDFRFDRVVRAPETLGRSLESCSAT